MFSTVSCLLTVSVRVYGFKNIKHKDTESLTGLSESSSQVHEDVLCQGLSDRLLPLRIKGRLRSLFIVMLFLKNYLRFHHHTVTPVGHLGVYVW